MILAFDTYYFEDKAKTVAIQFKNWIENNIEQVYEETISGIDEYVSGSFYKRERQPLRAFPYYLESSKTFFGIKNKTRVDSLVQISNDKNVGVLKRNENKFDTAAVLLNRSLDYAEKLKDSNWIGINCNSLAILFQRQGDILKSISFYKRSLQIKKTTNHIRGLSNSQSNISALYSKIGYKDSCYKYAILALSNAKRANFLRGECNATEAYATALYLNDKKDSAYKVMRVYTELMDSVNLLNKATEIADLDAIHQNVKKDAELELKNAEMAVADQFAAKQKSDLDKQRFMTNAFVFGLILVLIIAVVIFYSLIRNRKKNRIILLQKLEVEEKNREILDSINYAKRIQNAILPPDLLVKEYLASSFIHYKPKDIVAGDFYWMEPTKEGVIFAAADCTGHGVPGAMVSVVCNNGLNRSVREYGLTDPGKVLDKTREIVIQEFEKSEDEVKDGMDIALCKLNGNSLEFAGAHNPLWIIRKGASEIEEIKANKQPIGKFLEPLPYTTHKVELNKGDSIYIFSDGYLDQFGGDKGKKFKTANFKKLLISIQGETMENQKKILDQTFEDWRGSLEQLDDVCVIGVKI